MNGHDGQSIAIVPSRELAVLRLGLTPSKLKHRPQALVHAVVRALPRAAPGFGPPIRPSCL